MSFRSLLAPAIAVLVLAATACGRAPANEADKLSDVYASASAEYAVPRPILEAIGYLETHWVMRPGEPSVDQGYGVMHLTDWAGRSQLEQAAQLTGYPAEQLKRDPEANIRAAAALLRAEADRYFAETPAKREGELADWWQVVMRYSGLDEAEYADDFATDVYHLINRGAQAPLGDASVYRMAPHLVDVGHEKLFGQMESAVSPDYAAGIWRPASSNNYTGGRSHAIDMVVIHTAQGSYSSVYSWFANPSAQVSAHYVVRSSDGEVTSMVHDRDTAWHAGDWTTNTRSIGIEHEGFVDQPSYLTEAMYQGSANLTRWICDTYHVPKDRQHIIGHYEVPSSNTNCHPMQGGSGCHHDPCVTLDGSQCYWNWQHYMQLVGGSAPVQTGLLTGTIFSSEGGCTFSGGFHNCNTVVAGARVFIAETGATVLADANGKFHVNLSPGTYSVNASAPGFHDSGPVLGARPVTAGATTFSSVILQKIQTTGTVKGIVYVVNGQDAADHSQRVEGALVSVGTTVVSTNANGEYALTVGSGAQTVTATKDGYLATSDSANVPGGGAATLDLGLKTGAPTITFTRPAEGATVSENPVRVEGTVSGPVVSLSVGTDDVQVGADLKWVANVQLAEGANEVAAVATDASGSQGKAVLHVTWVKPKEGVQGVVTDVATGKPVKDAVVSAGDKFSKTGDDGRYSLDLAAGDQALSVQAVGYLARSVSVTVPTGARTSQDISLVPSAAAGSLLVITSPAPNSTVTNPQIQVTGTVQVQTVSLKVNDQDATVTDGTFTASVTLKEGDNDVVAKAKTRDGLELTAQVKVTYDLPATKSSGCGCQAGALDASLLALLGLVGLRRRRTA